MTETDVNVDPLVDLIHDAGCPVHLNVLTRRALRSWLEAKAQERHYAPGAHFKPGERIRFQGQWATVADVQAARNPVQGDFSVLTITLSDGSACLMAADIPGGPAETRQPVTEEVLEDLLNRREDEARRAARAALDDDPRLVFCSTPQGEIWCLQEMVPEVTREEVRSAEAILPHGLVDGELVSCTTEELAEAIWGLEDDGGDDYALCAFALRRALDDHESVVNLGDRWAHAQTWRTLRTERESLTSPRQPCEVEIPQGIETATASEVAQASAWERVEEEEPQEETPEPQDLEAWRKDHPDHAIFTLRARHYYEGWLPLSQRVRRLFPPLGIGQQEVTFHHRFGDEPKSFPAYVDRDAGRILLSPKMYETFRSHRIYPGARLRLSVRNEQEFDLATRETDKREPIRVWRIWLNDDGKVEYDDFEEQPRYDIEDDVYVADVRFEDREALFRQAEETGASIYQLMYEKAVEWWEENDRNSLVVTADELFDAIHRDEQGRMVSKATIGWELWERLAFKPLGGGRYRFRPEFGAEVRLAVPSQRVEPPELVAPPEAPAYFIFQQHPDSEYADEAGEIYNWRKGIPGSRQIVEGARFIYYRPGEQVFFGAGRVASIDTYTGEDGETYYDGHIADYEPWDPPLPLTPELAQRVSFISPDRLGVGQAGIRKISRDDFVTIVRACGRGPRDEHAPKLVTEDRDELWDRVTQLEGQTLYTLSQRSPFKVARVTEGTLTIELEEGTPSSLARQKLEGAYAQLTAEGQISRSDIEAFLRFNSSYAAAILASLPNVEFETDPIWLFYEAPSRQPREPVAPATERTRSGQLVATELVPPGPLFESLEEPTSESKGAEDGEDQPEEVRGVSPDDFSMGVVDEVINIRALRAGEQIVLCKTYRKSNNRIFLLPKVSFASDFEPSEFAEPFLAEPVRRDVTRHVAEIEYLSVPGESRAFWEELFKLGEFNLWDVDEGPLVYFEGVEDKRALLWILRVYELPFRLAEGEDFERGRRGTASITNDESLRKIQAAFAQGECEPVVADPEFERRNQVIISTAQRFEASEGGGVGRRPHTEEDEKDGFGPDRGTEFQQIKEVVEASLEGKTVYQADRVTYWISSVDEKGFSVNWSYRQGITGKPVHWEELEELYSELRRRRRLDRTGRRTYEDTALFRLLSQFSHIRLRTEPRQELIYREPEGPVRLRGAKSHAARPTAERDGTADQDDGEKFQSRIDSEFRQIRAIIEDSVVGETIFTLAQRKSNQILDSDDEGLTVLARTESKVRWEWIRDVYDALYHLRQIEPKDVQEGEFQTPGGYRGAFIFALLARFAHIEARTDPRRLIYHKPKGPIRLRDTGEDDDSSEPLPGPPASPTSGSPGAPGSRQPTASRKLMSPSGRPDDMQTKTLFSHHYLQNRLPDHAEWQEDPRAVFEAVWELWQRAREYGDTWNESQTEQEFIQPMLELLGWAYIVQPKAHQAGQVRRPDYALFPDDVTKDDAAPHQGDDAAFYSRVPAIAEAKYWGRPLSEKDPGGREKWDEQSNPGHQMVSYLVGTRVGWGILTNGLTWRLYSREVSSTASEYYEIDLGLIFDSLPDDGEPTEGQLGRFRRWWLFFRQQSFVPDAQGRSFVERIHEGSDTYARRISDTLKKLVYEKVMPEIAGGFVAYRHHQARVEQETGESLRQIYRASLSLLYKLLFLLYGEARALLPVDKPGYREQSLTKMAQWAAEHIDKGLTISDATHATARYDGLMALFHRVDRGDPSLGIPRYDGGLFDPSSPENQFLERHKLSDRAVALAVDTLVRDAGEPVDYAYIGVQNLGSIYEGLLENRLRVVDAAAGEVELIGDQGERKATGSYYTPDYIVEYIVRQTLDPILEERDEAFRSAMDRCAELRRQLKKISDATTGRRLRAELDDAERKAREAFLGIKVLDPAMGSGHFLVNAVDHLTDAIIRRMQVYHDEHPKVSWDWNPIQRLIEQVRGAILAEMERQGIQLDPARLDDTALLIRLVMKRCIYGVDLNRMAVELAKVSLWLHTFTVGAPLSFLDHHLRWGNSLIGTDVRTVGEQIRKTGAGQLSLWQGPFAGLLDLTGLMVEVVERADATLADVEQSAETFKQFRKELTPYKQVLDLWVSQYFGNELAKEFLTVQGDAVVPALKGKQAVPDEYQDAIAQARKLYKEKRFFHWDLEFPEVFIDLRNRDWAGNPGFDAVIGNPPYLFITSVPGEDRDYYFSVFKTCDYRFDVYGLFAEQGLDIAQAGAGLGLIIPHSLLNNNSFEKLRAKILDTASYVQIVDFTDSVFPEAANEPMILIVRSCERTPARPVLESSLVASERLAEAEGTLRQYPASLVQRLPGRPFIVRGGEWLENLLEARNNLPLKRFVRATQGLRTGDNARFLTIEPSDGPYRKALVGADLSRYAFDWAGICVLYDRDQLDAPRAAVFWETSPKILVQEIRNVHLPQRIVACVDADCFIGLNTTNALILRPRVETSLYYIMSVVSSKVINEFFRSCFVDNHIATQYLESIPLRRIAFTTPPREREGLVKVGTTEAIEWIEAPEGGAVESVALSSYDGKRSEWFRAFSDSDFGRWLDERLSPVHTPDHRRVRKHNADPLNEDWQLPEGGPVEQSDVVHDLLAHLAEQMTGMHKERQSRVETFWLDLEGVTEASVYEALHDHGKWESSLWKAEPCRDFVDEESRSTVHLDESLGWNEPCFKAFVKMLAGNVSNLSDVVTVYRKHHPDYHQLMRRIAATDRLIDFIVYRLYGLTEEEVAVVEGESP